MTGARRAHAAVAPAVAVALALVIAAACHRRDHAPPPPPSPSPAASPASAAASAPEHAADLDRLAAYLRGVAALDDTARRREVASWQLDEPTFRKTVQPLYWPLYADYAARFADAIPTLAAAFDPASGPAGGPAGAIAAKRHYADDPTLTPSQFRIRWALPTEYPTAVATRGGAPIDMVFAPAPDDRWGVLANFDTLVRERVRALAPACDGYLDRATKLGRCGEVGWAIVEAAMRADTGRLAHACQLAAAACGT